MTTRFEDPDTKTEKASEETHMVSSEAPVFDLLPEGLADVGSALGRTRIRTLINLRWIAVIGQAIAVLVVHFVLGYEVHLSACLAAISASAWLNLFLMATQPEHRLSRQVETAAQSGFDIIQLAVLIALTGGLDNPFLLMILAPVTVAAARLKPTYAMLLVALSLVCVALMAVWSHPLPWREGEALNLPPIYRWGQFAAVATGLVFFAVSAARTGRDEARLVHALDAAEDVLSREQRLSALGALSAATAHELGTPLATIHLVAKELARSTSKDAPLYEDVSLMADQAERCRRILNQISTRREMTDAAHAKLPLSALIEEASSPHRGLGITIKLSCQPLDPEDESAGPQPEIRRRPEILHALGAFIENAVSFAKTEVQVAARWSATELRIYISDDGPGFAQNVLPKLGEPYLSQRGPNQRGGGMGLGFFIARTLIERTGARLTPFNRSAPNNGAVVKIAWDLKAVRAAPGWSEQ